MEENGTFSLNSKVKALTLNSNEKDNTQMLFDREGNIIEVRKGEFVMSWKYDTKEVYRLENGKEEEKYTLNSKGNVVQTDWINEHDLHSVKRLYYDDKNRLLKIERDENNVDNDLASYVFKTFEYIGDTLVIKYNGTNQRVNKFCLDKCGDPKIEIRTNKGVVTHLNKFDYKFDERGNWIQAIVSSENVKNQEMKVDTIFRKIEYYN
jgi:hypothetical protein